MPMLRVFAVALVMSFVMVQASLGETSLDRQGDVVVAGSELMQGVLDRVVLDGDKVQSVIIDDLTYRVDDNTKATTASGRSINISSYKPGTPLDFYVLDGLLIKMMPGSDIEEGSNNEPSVTTPVTGSNSTEMHLEDGVWKN